MLGFMCDYQHIHRLKCSIAKNLLLVDDVDVNSERLSVAWEIL